MVVALWMSTRAGDGAPTAAARGECERPGGAALGTQGVVLGRCSGCSFGVAIARRAPAGGDVGILRTPIFGVVTKAERLHADVCGASSWGGEASHEEMRALEPQPSEWPIRSGGGDGAGPSLSCSSSIDVGLTARGDAAKGSTIKSTSISGTIGDRGFRATFRNFLIRDSVRYTALLH